MFVFPLAVYPIAKFGQKMRQVATRTQVTLGSLTTLLQETISGTRIVKAFSMEEYENKRFSVENERLFRLYLKAVSITAVSSPFMEFLGGLGISAIIFYGGYQVYSESGVDLTQNNKRSGVVRILLRRCRDTLASGEECRVSSQVVAESPGNYARIPFSWNEETVVIKLGQSGSF